MHYAVSKLQNCIISAFDRIDVNDTFKCPHCGEDVYFKQGSVNVSHFAHKPGSVCVDSYDEIDMSLWHIAWQNMVPDEYTEIPMSRGFTFEGYVGVAGRWGFSEYNENTKHYNDVTGKPCVLVRHRADMTDFSHYVIEFQNTPISPEKVAERIQFYSCLGYKVVWVFNIDAYIYSMEIYDETDYANKWSWERPAHWLKYIQPSSDYIKEKASIWFCCNVDFEYDVNNKPKIADSGEMYNVCWANPYYKCYERDLYNDITNVPYFAWTRFMTKKFAGCDYITPYKFLGLLADKKI